MSIENIDDLKPSPKVAHSDAKLSPEDTLDFLGKYRNDLEFLKNGKISIERSMSEKGIDNEVITKKLKKLTKSITHLEQMINEFEENNAQDVDDVDDNESSDTEEDSSDSDDVD